MLHPMLQALAALRDYADLVRRRARDDAGYSTETVIVTALLAILALSTVGIIAAKVLGKANSIDLG
ncbi:hypothetical protein JBE04_36995 [Streptomyces sp. PRKS01-29]|nr:hypothetical protein [Streptomyces sabulosicollis]